MPATRPLPPVPPRRVSARPAVPGTAPLPPIPGQRSASRPPLPTKLRPVRVPEVVPTSQQLKAAADYASVILYLLQEEGFDWRLQSALEAAAPFARIENNHVTLATLRMAVRSALLRRTTSTSR